MSVRHEVTPGAVTDLLVNSSLVCKLLARYQDSGDRLERAARMAESSGDLLRGYRVASEKAALCYTRGLLDEGLELARRVIEAGYGKTGEHQASALNTAGNIHLRRCQFEQAEALFTRALEHYRGQGKEISVGIILNNRGNISNVRGDYAKALQLYGEALGIFERHGDTFRTAHVLHSTSQILLSQHQYTQAKANLLRSLDLRLRIEDHRGVVNSLLVMVGLETDLKDFNAAREHLRQVDETLEAHGMGEFHMIAYRHGTAGILHFNAGDLDEAEECFLKLIGISENKCFAEFLAGGWNWLGKTRVYRDRTPVGLDDIRKGIGLAEAGQLPYEAKNGWGYLAECLLILGDREGAARAADRYKDAALKQGLPEHEVERSVRGLLAGVK